MSDSNRRRYARYDVTPQEVNVWSAGRAFRGEMTDQGIGGVGLLVDPIARYAVAVGATVHVQSHEWAMAGTLRHLRPEGKMYRFGIEWLDIPNA